MASAVFKIKGMDCNNCVDIIRSSVSAIEGVDNVKIDFEQKQVKVDFDSDEVQTEQIKDTISDAGYEVVE